MRAQTRISNIPANLFWWQLQILVNAVTSRTLLRPVAARCIQEDRYASTPHIRTNADATGEELNKAAMMSPCAKDMLTTVSERFKFSARGYHRVMRVARTIADLDASGPISRSHLAEAVSFRLLSAPET